MWKLIVGVLILLVLIAAVIVLIVSTLKDKDITPSTGTTTTTVTSSTEDIEGDGVDSIDGSTSTSTGTDTTTGTGTSTGTSTGTGTGTSATVEKVTITYAGNETVDFTLKTSDPSLTLKAVTVPANTEVPIVWSSSDENVFIVLQTGKVTAIGKGDATLTATCGSVKAECTVRVR